MIKAIQLSSFASLLTMLVNLSSAFVLGSLIGVERQIRQRTAGLRTNTLVAVGASIFVSLGYRLFEVTGGPQTPIHVVAYVVSGIGFLGAGAIMKEGASISGLNTAATLWGSGAVGACCGAGLIGEATLAALFVLASNTLLRPVVNRINRSPFDEESSEANYMVIVLCARQSQSAVREKVLKILEMANYPARLVDDHPFGNNEVEIEITLYATAIQPDELESVIKQIESLPGVLQAFWNSSEEG